MASFRKVLHRVRDFSLSLISLLIFHWFSHIHVFHQFHVFGRASSKYTEMVCKLARLWMKLVEEGYNQGKIYDFTISGTRTAFEGQLPRL